MTGSEGYYIRVYEDKVAVLGRNFITGEWVSSAQFIVNLSGGGEEEATTPSETTTASPEELTTAPETTTADNTPVTEPAKGCSSALSTSILPIIAIITLAAIILTRKRRAE